MCVHVCGTCVWCICVCVYVCVSMCVHVCVSMCLFVWCAGPCLRFGPGAILCVVSTCLCLISLLLHIACTPSTGCAWVVTRVTARSSAPSVVSTGTCPADATVLQLGERLLGPGDTDAAKWLQEQLAWAMSPRPVALHVGQGQVSGGSPATRSMDSVRWWRARVCACVWVVCWEKNVMK